VHKQTSVEQNKGGGRSRASRKSQPRSRYFGSQLQKKARVRQSPQKGKAGSTYQGLPSNAHDAGGEGRLPSGSQRQRSGKKKYMAVKALMDKG